jgi:hypothetical protein
MSSLISSSVACSGGTHSSEYKSPNGNDDEAMMTTSFSRQTYQSGALPASLSSMREGEGREGEGGGGGGGGLRVRIPDIALINRG